MNKNLKVWAIRAGLMALPFLAMAQGQGLPLIDKFKDILNQIITILFIAVTAYFFYGVILYVMAAGNDEKIAEGRNHILWGLIGMAAMAAAWGIVNVLVNYFGVDPAPIPTQVGQ